MYVLTTLHKLRQYIGLDSTDTSEDSRLIDALLSATRTIEHTTGRRFLPQVDTLTHTVNPYTPQECLLRDDLLVLSAITTSDDTTINIEDVSVVDGYLLKFETEQAISSPIGVTGIWGYQPDWSNAWSDSGDSVQNVSLSATDTTLEVNDVDAGVTRFQVGQLLRIDEEYLVVTAIDTDSDTLTVGRGVNGTIASTHSTSTPIEIYQVAHNIQQITLRWALWYYREPDTILTELPPVLLNELKDIRRVTVGS